MYVSTKTNVDLDDIWQILLHTLRGRSQAQHVRDHKAEVQRATKSGQWLLRRSKGQAHRTKMTFGL